MTEEECPICSYDIEENALLVTICCKNHIHQECFKNCIIMCTGKCPFCRTQFTIRYNNEIEEEIECTRISHLIIMATLLCVTFFMMVIFLPIILLSNQ